MSALELVNTAAQALFVLMSLVTIYRTIREPTRFHIQVAILFACVPAYLSLRWAAQRYSSSEDHLLFQVMPVVILAMPYLLVRLAAEFVSVRKAMLQSAAVGLAAVGVIVASLQRPLPSAAVALAVAYFLVFTLYASGCFFMESRRSTGVTRRRMLAVSCGSLFLAAGIVTASLSQAFLDALPQTMVSVQLLGVASAIAYFLGFAPPAFVRRAWQEPESLAFFSGGAALLSIPDKWQIIHELERGAAKPFGSTFALIVLADHVRRVMRFNIRNEVLERPFEQAITYRVIREQRPRFYRDLVREDPANERFYRRLGAASLLAAPMTVGEDALGVLAVFSSRIPVFAEDDLALVRAIADQTAVILKAHSLIETAAHTLAREEAMKLREDFLAAAAHDLRSPLTTIALNAQVLERQLARGQASPLTVQRIAKQVTRMRALIDDLLEARQASSESAQRRPTDVVDVAREVCERLQLSERCAIRASGPVVSNAHPSRIAQLLENLLQNAVKYSPPETAIELRVAAGDDEVLVSVTDHGIGISPGELPHIFERFYRGSNAGKAGSGVGLGLFVCRMLVEKEGGRVWAESVLGKGTSVHVALPLVHKAAERTAS